MSTKNRSEHTAARRVLRLLVPSALVACLLTALVPVVSADAQRQLAKGGLGPHRENPSEPESITRAVTRLPVVLEDLCVLTLFNGKEDR